MGRFFQKRLSNISPGQVLGDLGDLCKIHYRDCVEEIKAKRFVTIIVEDIYTTSNPILHKLNAAALDDLENQIEYIVDRQLN